jgi:hypothetical protein
LEKVCRQRDEALAEQGLADVACIVVLSGGGGGTPGNSQECQKKRPTEKGVCKGLKRKERWLRASENAGISEGRGGRGAESREEREMEAEGHVQHYHKRY